MNPNIKRGIFWWDNVPKEWDRCNTTKWEWIFPIDDCVSFSDARRIPAIQLSWLKHEIGHIRFVWIRNSGEQREDRFHLSCDSKAGIIGNIMDCAHVRCCFVNGFYTFVVEMSWLKLNGLWFEPICIPMYHTCAFVLHSRCAFQAKQISSVSGCDHLGCSQVFSYASFGINSFASEPLFNSFDCGWCISNLIVNNRIKPLSSHLHVIFSEQRDNCDSWTFSSDAEAEFEKFVEFLSTLGFPLRNIGVQLLWSEILSGKNGIGPERNQPPV